MNAKNNKYLVYGLILATGIFIGWLLFRNSSASRDGVSEHPGAESEAQIWTCSMHPQFRQNSQGKCPICAMDLIPLKTSENDDASVDAIQLSENAIALANIQTSVVKRGNPVKEIRMYGTIKPNEKLLHSLVSHVSGRIESLTVNNAGENIREGQTIAAIYSPDLFNAQQELLDAKKLESTNPSFLAAAREKLRHWKLSDRQIAEIEQSGKASPTVNISANASGTVINKRVEHGNYVSQGSVLFDLANLSSVWAIFDAYESDLPNLKTGDRVEYTLQSLPGKVFSGKISFIDPVLDKTARTAKIRVETPNPKLELKPEMYAAAIVKTSPKYSDNAIIIPKTAILWTGKRSIVYVKQQNSNMPTFKLREIELGASFGDEYVVLSGISEGEEIVVNGTFTIDASAQLEGKSSMMNSNKTVDNEKLKTFSMKVYGMCGMCKQRIEKAANIDGTIDVEWDDETQLLRFSYHEDNVPDEIARAVAKAGHDNDKYKADDKVYNALPGCCKYRE
ncbi:MAG: efflux RND transporter periplasmic adaptor subunit [Dysgonamonadaceae bacterium]|jgi:Cu(I)/Ag(I) efflux system membrane fusion protein|nr:efflux RND transporter periplasmic adaptor subunit [Dysgonamonadaceae bacterium]